MPPSYDRTNGAAPHQYDTDDDEDSASTSRNGEPKKSLKPIYPLTGWHNTPQNAVCIAFILGCVFTTAMWSASSAFTVGISGKDTSSLDYGQRLYQAFRNPRLGLYVTVIVTFHLLEYLTTAIWNPAKVNIRSFLLDDRNHNAAHIFALLEFILEETFLPTKYIHYKKNLYLIVAGIIVTVVGQYLRSLAMITAATNFSHLIVYTKAPEHSLVRTGIYGWSRHPSYAAFFYWALGTQLLIGNPLSFVVFVAVLYRFFSHRIRVEEYYLVKFFGTDYQAYQKEVSTKIPFIR